MALIISGSEQNETACNQASSVVLATNLPRFHNAAGTGALNGPNGAEPKAGRTCAATWPDAIGRPRSSADYGTNGGADLTRPEVAPERSDAVLVSANRYGVDGAAAGAIDPAGTETRWHNDALARRIRLIENFVEACSRARKSVENGSGASIHVLANAATDANRVTEFAYHPDGGLELLTLINDTTGNQFTRWVYGTTLADSGVATSFLLRAKIYPESDDKATPLGDGPDGVYERLEYTYNRQGNAVQFKDPNETVHQYDYDLLARPTQDRVTAFASHIDQAVKRLSRGYDLAQRLATVTSHDNAAVGSGGIVNEIGFEYDDFGQIAEDKQAHGGAVGGSTPQVGYAHADASSGNTARRVSMTYPNGRQLDLGYGAAGSHDNLLSRVASIQINGEISAAAENAFVGLARYVKIGYPEPAVELTYIKSGRSGV